MTSFAAGRADLNTKTGGPGEASVSDSRVSTGEKPGEIQQDQHIVPVSQILTVAGTGACNADISYYKKENGNWELKWYAASLPLRPVMVFIPEQKRLIVAQFRQNSLLRLEKGDDAEAVFNALPGQVFHGKLVSILPVVPGGTYQAQGALQSLTVTPGSDGVLATIELDPNAEIDALPDGIYAQVAVYSDHFAHVSVMRKVLLRMTSWMHYLYLDH